MNFKQSLQSFKGLNLFRRKRDLVGVDVGSYSIKIVLLRRMGAQWSLMHWGVIPYGEDLPAEATIFDRRGPAALALQNYLRTNPLNVAQSATSVSGNSVIVRYVKIDKMTSEQLSKNLLFHAEPYIPFNIDEVNLSFSILEDVVEDGQSQMETVLVAAKKEAIDLRIELLKEAGLQPVIVDVDAFALENAYELNFAPPQDETVLFMNLGAGSTNMSIVERGVSKVVRDVFIAGNTFTKAIQRQFQCDIRTAEEKKIKYGLAEDNTETEAQQVIDALFPVARDLLSEVQRSIDFYISQGSDRTVHRILLCGGTANLKMLDQYLNRELKIPVEIFNPLAAVGNAPTDLSDQQIQMLPQLAVAVGLAVRRLGDGAV